MKAPTTAFFAAGLAMAALAACGSEESADQETTVTETTGEASDAAAEPAGEIVGDAAAGERTFAQCAVCHAVEPGRSGIGPSLHGVFGRAAASVEGFNYSPAMRESGLTWTAEALGDYLESPQRTVPGTRMSFAGLRDPQQRADVIAYLETLQ